MPFTESGHFTAGFIRPFVTNVPIVRTYLNWAHPSMQFPRLAIAGLFYESAHIRALWAQ